MSEEKKKKNISSADAFSSVAVWQLLTFILLICFVWANEVLDIPHRMFNAAPSGMNIYRGFILSAGIITAAIVAVGHTYERQRAVIQKMLMSCEYCHRVMHDDGHWEHVEKYFLRAFPMEIDHGACPECDKMLAAAGERPSKPDDKA